MENNKKIYLDSTDEAWLKTHVLLTDQDVYLIFKRVVDVVVGTVGFIIFIILFPFFALAIKLDSDGDVIFQQKRTGKNGKIFVLYKFRTLKKSKQLTEGTWREKDIDVVTRVGKMLRRSHLDELPQAINLLKGDMSFVGPRAEWEKLADVFEKQIPFYHYRYVIKPGLIGWAQINFPPSKSVQEAKEKFEYDLFYIVHRSITFDIKIILLSFKLFSW